MRRIGGAVAIISGAVLLAVSPVAEACGDKLLSISRGIRLQQAYKALHPAHMLMYVGEVREERDVLVELSILYMSLRQAGHQIEVAQSTAELDTALRNAEYDFVLADHRDVATVAVVIGARAVQPSLIPVLFEPGEQELATAEEQFPLVLKTPAASTDHLEAIDREGRGRSTVALSGI